MMKRLIGPLLLVVLLVSVGVAIYFSVKETIPTLKAVPVRGLIASDEEEFFKDPRVIKALERGGFKVDFEKAGSRQMATNYDLGKYDFAFSAGSPAAEKIRSSRQGTATYDIFYTPMAIATWKPIVQILEANGMAKNQGVYYTFNMDAYLQWVAKDTRWKDLTNSGAYPLNKSMLIISTDVRKANSAGMYLGLASYVANGLNQVQSNDDIAKVQPLMNSLFLRQGFSEYSTEVPFEDYLAMGMGKSPMVFIYESQFISRWAQANNGMTADMVLMYPDPGIFSKHILVSLTPLGAQLGDFLKNDAEIQQLAIEHGYRTTNSAAFIEYKKAHGMEGLPNQIINVVEPPSYEVLEKMIGTIEAQYK